MFNVRWVLLFGLLSIGFLSLAACGDGENNGGSDACGGCGCGGDPVDEAIIAEPDGWKANKGDMDDASLLAKGDELWADKSLSGGGAMSCKTCHSSATAQYEKRFAKPYPHEVKMAAKRSVTRKLTAAEMVQFCLVVPMKADPLKWDDEKLAALTRKVEEAQKEYKKAIDK